MNRGDLGFIPNARGSAPNKFFFGSPGNPSKKFVGPSQVSRLNNETTTPPMKPDIESNDLIGKRTEWLESQERKLTATLHETKSDTNRLEQMMTDTQKMIETEVNRNNLKNQQLFNEMQVVYGLTSQVLHGLSCNSQNIYSKLSDYKNSTTTHELSEMFPANTWVTLMYPMEEVQISDTHTQHFMRCKTVDETTGQLSVNWVVVFETKEEVQTRFISRFALNPI